MLRLQLQAKGRLATVAPFALLGSHQVALAKALRRSLVHSPKGAGTHLAASGATQPLALLAVSLIA